MSTTVSYKGNTIATLNNETKTLTTAGTWVEGNITVTDTMTGVDVPVFTVTYNSDDDYAVISATCNKTYNEVYQSTHDDLPLAIENSVVVGSDSYEYSASLSFIASVGISNGHDVLPAGNYLYFISSGTQPGYDLYYSQSNVVYIINPSEAAKTLTVTENGHYVPEYGDYSWVEVNVNVPGGNSPIFTLTFNNNHTAITSVTCNKTFVECVALTADHTALFKIYTGSTYEGDAWASIVQSEVNNNEYTKIVYSSSSSLSGAFVDVTYESDGTITGTYPSAYALTLNATTNGTYTTNNHGTYTEVNVNVPTGTARTSSDLTVSGDTVTVPAGLYSSQATASVASGTAGTPTATKGTVSNHSISVTPSVTNTTGYITGGTKTGTAVTVSASELVSGTLSITSSGTKDVTNYASASVAAGTEGTPTATKGTVSNHQVSVTPSVTNTAGYISGSTKTGTAVTVTASELASGNKEITQNGTNIDVVGYSTVSVAVPSSSTAIITDTTDAAGGTIRTITTTDEVHLQTKNITPTSTQQTVLPDTGYDGFSSVIVGASSGGNASYTRTVIVPQQTVTPTTTTSDGNTYYSAQLNMSSGLESGEEYIITYNGTEYFYTCRVLWGTNYLLGEINYFYGTTGLPYPFGILWASGTTCRMACGDNTAVTVKIEKLEFVGSPSATAHEIYFEFSDGTDTTIDVYYDDSLISTMITAYTPTTYGQKTVTLAELDGVAWYEPMNIPLNTQLVDYTTLTADHTLDENTGELVSVQWYAVTDYIVIDPSMTFSFKGSYWHITCFYDSSKTFISGFSPYGWGMTQDSNDSNTGVGTLGGNGITIPSNAMYIRISTVNGASASNCSLIRTA